VQDLETATRIEVYRGLGAGYDANVEAAWSPDGRRLAFFQMLPAEREDTNQRWDLSIVDADGGSITVLGSLTSQLNASGPLAWSPDGTRVAFDDDILRVADVDARTIRDYEVYADSVAWSPDGAQIAVHGGGLLLVDSASGKARRLTSDLGGAVEYPPAWSLDGRWLAYVGSDDTLRVLEVASSAILRLPNEVDEIIWAKD
jgi:Tol biopolymer transport system component